MANVSRRIKKNRIDPADKVARGLEAPVPVIQLGRGNFVVRDVANHTEDDQRVMVRSKKTQTVRRKTRIERMVAIGLIDKDQQSACEWYANAHELGYATVGCTANYCGAGGGGFGSSDLFARYKAQQEAREDYAYARKAIPADYLVVFDYLLFGPDIDLKGLPEHARNSISLAAWLLHGQIGHMLLVAA